MSLKIVVTDEQTGYSEERRIGEGDYIVITAHPCEVFDYSNDPTEETATITVMNFNPQPLPDVS